jgi:all-trans-8'-apo-beta-carotenal 15,15'-oxygenase
MSEMLDIIQRAFDEVPNEVDDLTLELLEGALPPEIDGVLYRNGPGRLARGGQRYGHPFDGDGMVSLLKLDGGRGEVTYRNRFVRTREYLEEEREDAILFRGFGTDIPGGLKNNALRMRFKNAANTNIVAHGSHLLALWEGGWPHRLDPHTLATRDRFNYRGALDNDFSVVDKLLNPELPFSAHPKIDPETGELFNFGTAFGLKNRLLCYRVSTEGEVTWRHAVELDDLTFVHDFLITKQWLVFFLPAVSFDVASTLAGLKSPVGSITIDAERPMRILLVPRPGVAQTQHIGPRWLEADRGGFVFHHAVARERGRQLETVGMWLPTFPRLDNVTAPFTERGMPEAIARPLRFTLNLTTGQARSDRLSAHGAELPQASADGDVLYATAVPGGRKQPFFSGLLRRALDRDASAVLRDLYPRLAGEPVVVAAGGGEWLLSLIYAPAEHRTELWVLDSETLQTAARFALPHAQPPGLHGNFYGREIAEKIGAYG